MAKEIIGLTAQQRKNRRRQRIKRLLPGNISNPSANARFQKTGYLSAQLTPLILREEGKSRAARLVIAVSVIVTLFEIWFIAFVKIPWLRLEPAERINSVSRERCAMYEASILSFQLDSLVKILDPSRWPSFFNIRMFIATVGLFLLRVYNLSLFTSRNPSPQQLFDDIDVGLAYTFVATDIVRVLATIFHLFGLIHF